MPDRPDPAAPPDLLRAFRETLASGIVADPPRRSLAEFVRRGWHVIEPGTTLAWNWHIEAICLHLEAITRGEILRLIINVPPGHMKSLLVSVFWPAWEWIERPHLRGLFGSNDDKLAMRDQVKTRDLITSEWYQETFRPTWKLKADQNTKHAFANTMQGARQAFSMGQKITGHRGDKVVVDDPLDAKDQFNQPIKDACLWKWDKVLSSRVNDQRAAKFVVIMQRLADDDLSGHLLKRGGYEHLCFPSEFEPERRNVTSIGWTDPRTEPGELLFPEMFPADVLATAKRILGSDGFAGQHQQRPVSAEGGRFKRHWFRHWEHAGDDLIRLRKKDGEPEIVRLSLCRKFATADSAVSLKTAADYTVYGVWAVTKSSDLVLLHRERLKLEDPAAVQLAVDIQGRWKPSYWVVEANGVGKPRVQNLRAKGVAVREIDVHADKISRSHTAVIRCEAGQVFWPSADACPWLDEWEAEHVMFPFGQHDDQVDNTSLAAADVFDSGSGTDRAESIPPERRDLAHPRRDEGFSTGRRLYGR